MFLNGWFEDLKDRVERDIQLMERAEREERAQKYARGTFWKNLKKKLAGRKDAKKNAR